MKSRKEFEIESLKQMLRLVWPELKDDCEIVLVEKNPFPTSQGDVKLETHRLPMPEPVGRETSEAIIHYEFTGQSQRLEGHDYVYLLINHVDGIKSYARLYSSPAELLAAVGRPEAYKGKCPMCSGQLQVDGDLLECENQDYECRRADFENIWGKWETLREKDRDQALAVVDQLLLDLQSLNSK